MRQTFTRHKVAIVIWLNALAALTTILIAAHLTSSAVMAKLTSFALIFFLASTGWLFLAALHRLQQHPVMRLGLFSVAIGASFYLESWLPALVITPFIAVSSLIWVLANNFKGTCRQMSMSEKWYWHWMNEFLDGRTSIFPKKPK